MPARRDLLLVQLRSKEFVVVSFRLRGLKLWSFCVPMIGVQIQIVARMGKKELSTSSETVSPSGNQANRGRPDGNVDIGRSEAVFHPMADDDRSGGAEDGGDVG